MSDTRFQSALPRAATAGTAPDGRLAIAALVLLPAVAVLALGLSSAEAASTGAALAFYIASAAFAVTALQRSRFPHPTLGLCNVVTLARLALTSSLIAPLIASPNVGASGWAVLAIALFALSLDGIDGWLARREDRTSSFGARFDMEVDSALGLILTLNAWAAGSVGAGVLLLGLPRYVFLAASKPLPWLAAPLPDSLLRKAVCVVQIIALVVLQVPGLPAPAAMSILALGSVALLGSFGRDILWLWRTRS